MSYSTEDWGNTKIRRGWYKLDPIQFFHWYVSQWVAGGSLDHNVLSSLIADVIDYCERRPNDFKSQRGELLTTLIIKYFLVEIQDNEYSVKKQLKHYNRFKQILIHPRALNSDKYKNWKKLATISYVRIHRSNCEKPKEGRFIGVGYRDKGSCRNLAYDGNPDLGELYSDVNLTTESNEQQKVYICRSNPWITNQARKNLSFSKEAIKRYRKQRRMKISMLY